MPAKRRSVALQASILQTPARKSSGDELNKEQTREVTQIVGIALRENPRQVKQFLNTLTSKLMLGRLGVSCLPAFVELA